MCLFCGGIIVTLTKGEYRMTKLSISILSMLLVSTTVWAHSPAQPTEVNSFYRAVIERSVQNNHSQVKTEPSSPYTHETEKGNSLFRAALALQGSQVNLRLNSASEVSYSRYTDSRQTYNSLFLGAMAK